MNLPKIRSSLGWLLAVCLLFHCSLTLSAQDAVSAKNDLRFQAIPLTIDGRENDWRTELLVKDEETGISYAVTNNDSVFFIAIISQDDIAQTKMLRAGFSVFIDAGGKKKQSASLQFPLPVEDDRFPPASSHDLKAMETIGFMNARQYRLSGFEKGNGTFNIDQVSDSRIQVKIAFNEKGLLVYEAAIPFSAFYKKEKLAAEDNDKPVAVGFFINSLSRPATAYSEFSSRRTSVNLEDQFNTSRSSGAGEKKMRQLYSKSKSWVIVPLAIAGN